MTNTAQATIENTDAALAADINNDFAGWVVAEFVPDDATVSNQRWQVIFNEDHRRAGLLFCGSGSSGETIWTDAKSCEDAYQRMLDDNLSN